MLIIRHHNPTPSDKDYPFRFTKFICAEMPPYKASLRRGMVGFQDSAVDGQPILAHTSNIVAGEDPHVDDGVTLGRLYQERGKVVF